MSDPFQQGHSKDAAKKAVQDAAAEVLSRDRRIADAAARKEKLAKPKEPYPWPKKFFDLSR